MQRTPIAPTAGQLAWQRKGLGVFFHVGINTFAGLEWSDGTIPATDFAPTDLDADEWVRTAKELGAAYVILTAKHHDGFCLWPTATTSYSVASSPWKDGHGDVVREVADACRRHDVELGLYLSPWDRNAECYDDPEAYDAFYLAQLRELCTDYGPLMELWFDGAGSAGREYDWAAIGEVIEELQPGAMVFNMGPATIRWVGNEDGLAADPCEYVVRATDLNNYDEDVVTLGEPRYLPPECDVSLRRSWFWQEGEEPKSLPHLLAIHDRSIGLGAGLLLNIPPDRRGRIDPADAARVTEFAQALEARFGAPRPARLTVAGNAVEAVLGHDGEEVRLDHIELREALEDGQRVTGHRILLDGRVIAQGQTVGVRRIHRLAEPVQAARLRIEVDGEQTVIDEVITYDAGDAPVPDGEIAYLATTQRPDGGD